MYSIFSPGKKIEVRLQLDDKGSILYDVSLKGQLCASGTLGISTSLMDFREGVRFIEAGEQKEINESYSLPVGKKESYENHCTEEKLHFEKEGVPLIVAVRAYDNGAAFSYEIPVEGKDFLVNCESTDFCFPEAFQNVWLQEWVRTYEGPYNRTTWGPDHDGCHYAMPALISAGAKGPWIMINEAAVLNKCGDYCVSHVKGTSDRRLVWEFAPEEKGQPIPSSLPFVSPWRYLLVEENLNDLVNSTMNYNLNPPSDLTDTSWIKPARALWAWWINDTGAQVYTEIKDYVDYAASMGFEAVVVDAGWDETWMRQLCDYAHERNISPWLWVGLFDVDTEEKAEYYFPLWKSWGIDGVKIDVIENDSAYTAWQYSMLAGIMAREKLMVNFHGCTKPMGEGRTWPHFIAAEGIMGLEYYKWSDGPNAEHNCTVPYIRNVAGPMDYTPVGFNNPNRNTSMAHQMALAAVFESGCTHFAASIYNLEGWSGTPFLRRLKPKYDGLKLLSGYPGNHVAMLRWVKESEEYIVGCICNQQRTLHLSLDFLPEGTFEAEVYKDDRFGDEIVTERLEVTRDSVVILPMVEHGGAGLYIARKIEPLRNLRPEGYLCEDYQEISAVDAYPLLGSRHGVAAEENPTPVLVLSGGASFVCDRELAKGMASIRLFYRVESDFLLKISDGVTTVTERVPASGYSAVLSTYTIAFPFIGGKAKLVLERVMGGIPSIDKLRVIENHPAQGMILPVETGTLYGKGAILSDPWGGYMLSGMEKDSVLRMENVMLPRSGEYILRVRYYAGPSGSVFVRVNDGKAVHARLAGLSKWSSKEEGDFLMREILVPFKEGANTIEVTTDGIVPILKDLEILSN